MKRTRMYGFGMGKIVNQLIAIAITLTFSALVAAQGNSADKQKVFEYSTDSETVILSYSETPDLLANPDPTPRIQVYGDGRVLVHYPNYMKRAGEYQLYLTPGELRQLLVATSDAVGFDARQAAQVRREERKAQFAATGIATERSDEDLERIEIRLNGFQRDAASSKKAVNERVEWRGIRHDVRENPGVPGINGLGRARDALRELLERPDLEPLQ
mgnify:CR=1 FL=1